MTCLTEYQIREVIVRLSNPVKSTNSQEIDYSIYATAMRTVIANAQPSFSNARVITSELLPVLRGSVQGSVDNMDVLISLIQRFGSSFTAREVLNTEQTLLSVLQQEKGLVQKRSITALGIISRYLETKQYVALITYICDEFSKSKNNYQTTKNLCLLCGTVARSDMSTFKGFLPNLLPVLTEALSTDVIGEEEDESSDLAEVRDAALQTLEVFSEFDSNTVEPYVKEFLQVCTTFLTYDPNFYDDDEVDIFNDSGDVSMSDEVEEEDDADGDYDDDFAADDEYDIDENAFSDDEDQTWKMRRHAAVLVSNLTKSAPGSLPLIYDEIFKLAILRSTKEREENVKITILESLVSLISAASKDKFYYTTKANYAHKRKNSDASMVVYSDPRELISEVLPVIIRYSIADLNKTISANLKHTHIKLLTVLVSVSEGLPAKYLERVVATITTLAGATSTPFLSDLLKLTSAILVAHNATELAPHLEALSAVTIKGISDSYYRTSLEGLETSLNLLPLYKENTNVSGAELMSTLISKFSQSAFDIETRKQAIHALGGLVSSASLSRAEIEESTNAIYKQLDNELLRVDALSAIALIASSQDATNALSPDWIIKTMETVTVFLKQSSATLRSESLDLLHALLKISASGFQTDDVNRTLKDLLFHAQALRENPSSAEVPLIGRLISIFADTIEVADSEVATGITEYAKSLLSKDYSLSIQKQLLAFFNKLTKLPHGTDVYDDVAGQLLSGSALVPGVLAACIVNGEMSDKLDDFVNAINSDTDVGTLEKSLNVLGHVGSLSELSISLEGVYNCLNNSSDKVRLAAAAALGSIVSSNLDAHLMPLLDQLKSRDGNSYLYLVAVRDVVLSLQNTENVEEDIINEIWNTLFSLSFKDDMSEESEKALAAECIGRLSILNPEVYLPALKEKLASSEVSVRRSVVSGVKYTFGLSLEKYDRLLRPITVDFLALMEDPNMSIRQVALGALTSAIHNKPHLLLPHLSRLLPLLYKETVINERLIRTVQMGPFKHKVDDGLDLRKAAYESMFTLATALPREWQLNLFKDQEFISRVLSGLDDEHDIRVLSCVTIARIVAVDVSVLGHKHPSGKTNMEELITKFTQIMGTTLKETAIKQEIENQGELERNVLRASLQIDKAINKALVLEDMDMKLWNTFMTSKEMTNASK